MNAAKFACSLLLSLLTVQLPACSFNMNVESMLSPPRLTAEQEQIYQALQRSVGSQQISLKYPKSGEHLSAFTVADLDDDGSDEAIVFYESSRTVADENPLRICLLGQQNGEWKSIDEYHANGAEVDRIDITRLGAGSRMNLVISYSMVDGADHAAQVCYYNGDALVFDTPVPYTVMTMRDFDQDGTTELFVANAAKQNLAAAALIYILGEEGTLRLQSQVDLPESFTDIPRTIYCELPSEKGTDKVPGICMDCLSGPKTVQTIVLSYEEKRLKQFYTDSADSQKSERDRLYQTMDVDGDGEAEIPVNKNFYGYNDEDISPVLLTNWFVCRGGLLMREHASYYAAQDGFIFLLPKRWEEQVTAVPEDGEIVFYVIDPFRANPDRTPVLLKPLLRLAVVTDPITADAMQTDGYLLLRQQNGRYYLGKTEQGSKTLALSDSELLFAMQYV